MNKHLLSIKLLTILSLLFAFSGFVKAQDPNIYWINEDFATFTATNNWITTVVSYPTAPNNIDVTTFYANVEAAAGTCAGTGFNFRVRGVADGGYLTFTVPNAGTVTIELKAKSSNSDRIAYVYRDNVLIQTFTGLDQNHCATFIDVINSNTPVNYKFQGETTADGTAPIIVSSIIVTKNNAPVIPFEITASAGEHGTIFPEGVIEVTPGEDTTFTITPDAGYKIKAVKVNGNIVFMNHQNSYSFQNVTQNSTIEAIFMPVPDASIYWINDNFSDFAPDPDYIMADSLLTTAPNGIGLMTYYANIETSEGNCNNESMNLRIRGLMDDGYAAFSVPNAGKVIIEIKGKSNAADRSVNIYRNDELVETFLNLDRDNCATFRDTVNTLLPITYKIAGGDLLSTKPIVISSIIVEKYAGDNINDNVKNHFTLYPNPVQDYVYIKTDGLSNAQMVNVFNMKGQCVITQKLSQESTQKIDVSNLSKGVYVARITNNKGEIVSYKLIK